MTDVSGVSGDPEINSEASVYTSPFTSKFKERFESPLSTKREKEIQTPLYRRAAPRIIKSVPPIRSVFGTKVDIYAKEITLDGTKAMSSPFYDSRSGRTFFQQNFDIIAKIGEGSFGEVFSVQSLEDKNRYAIKVSIEMFRNKVDRAKRIREVENHMLLPKHSNLVEFVKAWEEKGRLYIQTELCERSLLSYCNQNHDIPEENVWKILVDLISAVDFLHSRDLIHDDIKPDNIFLTKHFVCKLGDFGLIINLRKDELSNAEEGDSKYLAPEVLNGRPSKASDVFSLGVTMLETATDMDLPTCGDSWHQIRNGQIPEKFFQGVDQELRFLIEWMLKANPDERPTTKELLARHSISHRASMRKIFILSNKASDFTATLCTWLIALLSVLALPFLKIWKSVTHRREWLWGGISWSFKEIQEAQTPARNNGGSSKESSRPNSRHSCDFSDEESMVVHSQDVQSRILALHERSNLVPRYLLDHDDDIVFPRLRNETPQSPKRKPYQWKTPERGDCNDDDFALLRKEKLQRMYKRENDIDSDDNENFITYKSLSCPPARYNIRPVPRIRPPVLDFTILDNEDNVQPANNSPRRIMTRRRSRMMSDMDNYNSKNE